MGMLAGIGRLIFAQRGEPKLGSLSLESRIPIFPVTELRPLSLESRIPTFPVTALRPLILESRFPGFPVTELPLGA